ncbi:hypothetical protein KCU95_g12230, partial [Aureobasidium melanogenum]
MHITKPWSNTHSNYGLRPDNLLTKSRYYNYGGPPGRKYAFTGQTKTKARPGLPAGMVNVAPAEKYSSPKAPAEGWGLIGCEVEEYPFGNSQTVSKAKWNDRDFNNGKVFPVLRLIPGPENNDHGQLLKDRDDYCLEPGNDDYCHNACAIPYGADSTLVNYWKDSKNDDIRYDPWFDEKGKTFEHITKSVLGQKPEKTNLPSQYVGTPAPRKDDDKNDGASLIYDNYPGYSDGTDSEEEEEDDDDDHDGDDAMDTSARIKRYVAQAEERWNESSSLSPMKDTTGRGAARLPRRGVQTGSWLDPRVYLEILQCAEDTDPGYDEEEEDLDIQDEWLADEDSISSSSKTSSMTTTVDFKFCNTLLESSAIIGPGTHAPAVDPFFPDMTGKNFNGEPVFLHATWNGTGSSCEPLDFGNDSFSVSDGLEYTSGGMLLANFIEWGVRPADYASIEL